MKKLLSLPPNAVEKYLTINHLSEEEYFCTSDPVGHKLGSGGGTIWLLEQSAAHEKATSFDTWLEQEKRILVHAGGQSRRLPAYAASGKTSIPIPVFRWKRGQKIDQTLLDLQMPLYEGILSQAPDYMHTLIVAGDIFIRTTRTLQPIPDADVVCYGLWVDPSLAKNHGVFFMNRNTPDLLDFVLQKPTTTRMAELSQTHLAIMDIGIWLLGDRAVNILRQRSLADSARSEGNGIAVTPSPSSYHPYDLYSDFGTALGQHPTSIDEEINQLKVVILPLEGGEFYHYGTTPEMIASTAMLQNQVLDQRMIIQKGRKKPSTVFTQNAIVETAITEHNVDIWIENAHVPASWSITCQNVITGIPKNDWNIHVEPSQCVDIQAFGKDSYILRPYGYRDAMRGDITQPTTTYLGQPMPEWMQRHHIDIQAITHTHDLQAANIFPVCKDFAQMGRLLAWMLSPHPTDDLSKEWEMLPRLSADEIAAQANLERQGQQRASFLLNNLPKIAGNYKKSIFHQIDLKDVAVKYAEHGLELPKPLPEDALPMQQIHDAMFRAQVLKNKGDYGTAYEKEAFAILQQQMVEEAIRHLQMPHLNAYKDQIVWGRSAVRIDIAGGWTDTPPHCLLSGGNVINFAIELNGQQPLQVYVKPTKELHIKCRSIDLGAVETLTTYEELAQYNKVGSPFSIPKAALALCGFLPQFCAEKYTSLHQQLEAFGAGIEITLLSAIPAGSGLGTSSILASTVLGALADFCGLGWDKHEIGNRSLILEQLLTTGGGWQDQYGGILPGIKLLQTEQGFHQIPVVRWLPDTFFRQPEYQQCHLLYYTGITRTAKQILAEIVQGMFLNSNQHLEILQQMKQHALHLFDAIQLGDFQQYGTLIRKTWQQNKALDAGTEPSSIAALCQQIDDLCLGYKLPGAGGGGYLYMVAKDPEAAGRIREIFTAHPLTPSSRFVEMTLSDKGLQISRS
ncbi:MAG: bifunctional fucokinase/L-fucose-1-P-guanylyltransferase [Bacteroidaceae bacterium]|nr:bifunctional fucokinase/L-fucose-1-P-guanylyltransferase [Bacteroidaceae bacterium]